jgi:GAF domain-containing protein
MSDEFREIAAAHETLVATTFVELIHSLVDDFSVIDALTGLTDRTVQLLGAGAAGILLADSSGELRVISASSKQIGLLELFQIQNSEGPCFDCNTSGTIVSNAELDEPSPWPEFARRCVAAGYLSVLAIPLRLRDKVLGCLNLFMSTAEPLSPSEVAIAQALADVASVVIVQDEVVRSGAIREGNLQHALNSRVVIEQAKGMLAEHGDLTMEEAFNRLRAHARHGNHRLGDLAQAVVAGTVSAQTVITIPPPTTRPRPTGRPPGADRSKRLEG